MINKEDLLDTPFDQYSRQFQVADIVDKLRKDKTPLTILDVGGYKGKTTQFFPSDKVTVLDVFDVDEPNYVKASGLSLPFKDDAFDIVVNFDVLEHIQNKSRQTFINECARVAKVAFFICAPHKTEANKKAELELNRIYKQLHGSDHPWLTEHIAFGLPEMQETKKQIKNTGHDVVCLTSNDTLLWTIMQNAIFLNSKYPQAAPRLQELNRYYNKQFKQDGAYDEKESYRIIYFCTNNKINHKDIVSEKEDTLRLLNTTKKVALIDHVGQYYANLLNNILDENRSLKDHLDSAEKTITQLILERDQIKKENEALNKHIIVRATKKAKGTAGYFTKRNKK